MQEQRSTNIAMELRKAFVFGEVGVPYTNSLINIKLTSQVAADPSVSKRDKIYFQRFQMLKAIRIVFLDQRFHLVNNLMNSGLQVCIVILDVVDELWKAPERVSFSIQHILLKLFIYFH